MSATLGDGYKFPMRALNRELITVACVGIPIAASTGVVGTLDTPDPGITCSRASAGTYTLNYPPCPGRLQFIFTIEDTATQTIFAISVTARSSTAGTATFKTLIAAMTAADTGASSALTLRLTILGEANKDT